MCIKVASLKLESVAQEVLDHSYNQFVKFMQASQT